MKLTVNKQGVFLDDLKIPLCFAVEIKNICALELSEVVLHLQVSEVAVEHVAHLS